jgi:hypothetical protein
MFFHREMPRLCAIVALTFVCCQAGVPYLRAEPTSAPAASKEGVNPKGTADMDEIQGPSVKITAAEASRHQLPPAEISLNTGETGMSGMKFSSKDEYFSLSGPPGGPLGLTVALVEKSPKELDGWKSLIEDRFKNRSPEVGSAGEVELDGKARPAFTCTTDGGPSRAHHLLVLMAVPKSDKGLLIDFYSGAGETKTPSPQEMAKQGEFSEISPSFSIRFE